MKKIIEEKIFHQSDFNKPLPFSLIKNIVNDDDIIMAGWQEGWNEGDSACDGHFYITVTRKREETDEEYQARLDDEKQLREHLKKRRYQSYLKLKEEFEDIEKPE